MPRTALNELLRKLPSVDEAIAHPALAQALEKHPHATVVDAARASIDRTRRSILDGNDTTPAIENIAREAAHRLRALEKPSLRPVINASGVIVHTNLGRSALAESAVEAVTRVAHGYSTLEYNTEEMQRGSRHNHCEQLICALTGAEAAIAVNNNAAAVLLVLSEFASGHEAIVSRGELVEIGGSFRIPDIMELSHARMVEVGTTNKTHPRDYERAITDNTALLLKVHPSNYRIVGFTEAVEGRGLRRIADAATRERQARSANAAASTSANTPVNASANVPELLVYEDLGSGALLTLDNIADSNEPTVREALSAGCDLVSFSGDKLLGGPQAGIIVGSRRLIDRLKANPLARALRLDKMSLAALEATLRLYLDPERAMREIPTLRMLQTPAEAVRTRAEALAKLIEQTIPTGCAEVSVVPETSRAGGGALPVQDISTFAVCLAPMRGSAQSCNEHLVRASEVPIIARISKEALLFDARTILNNDEFDSIALALKRYFTSLGD